MIGTISHREGEIIMKNKILFIALLTFASLFLMTLDVQAQSPAPTPSPSASNETPTLGGYEITSSIELGVRGLSVNGNYDKFRSDYNYKPGFRVFDSSFLMEDKEGKLGGFFDSLLITSSGWSADPTGNLRVTIEKLGAYRFDANMRRVQYFNRLNSHINVRASEPGWKGADTKRSFGDFDLTIFPQNETLRLRVGSSFFRVIGTAGFTTRPFGDEFPINKNVDTHSADFHAGVDGKMAGFKLTLTGGVRWFEDESVFMRTIPHPGVDPTNVPTLTSLNRTYPQEGKTSYGIFTVQRTFAERLDFTGRFIYSVTDREFNMSDLFAGRGTVRPSTIVRNVLSDLVQVVGDTKRPQARGDIGVTYAITNKFRISNSFSFEQFDISGGAGLNETVVSTNLSTGATLPDLFSSTLYYRTNNFKRFANTFEGDYQFSNRFGINIGYRYSHRKIEIGGFNLNFVTQNTPQAINNPSRLCSTSTSDNPRIFCEEEENSTNTLLVGVRIKPTNNWSIFANAEHGEADNAFTRLSNYNFTNFRVKSNWNYKQFTFNVLGVFRDNENPSLTSAIRSSTGAILIPEGELIGNVKNRIVSAYVDWSPNYRVSISTGYTYHYLKSETDVVVPLAVLTRGFSEFYMRDNYAFIDVSAQIANRVSLFASYRFDKDTGQGDRISTAPQFIISSYPFRLNTPEIRLAVRLTKNIDWNVGYQYQGYRENLQRAFFDPIPPNQNYTVHLPYTSLRIYFGRTE